METQNKIGMRGIYNKPDSNKLYNISEIFTSAQGEGVYSGTMMTFVRIAGCSVGKPFPPEKYQPSLISGTEPRIPSGSGNTYGDLPIYTEECTLWDGRKFACDTDYRPKEKLSVDQILERVPKGVGHFCITGGEPVNQDLGPLTIGMLKWLDTKGLEGMKYRVHLETSGSVPLSKAFKGIYQAVEKFVWVTVSPKVGCLEDMVYRANELKILVDKTFDLSKLSEEMLKHDTVYLQPVNGEHTINKDNLKLVMALQRLHPQFRVSLQLHKVISDYIGERVL
jgi:7-carboxy-7-deazaguanine synthase